MAEKNLAVPYKSQHASDSLVSNNDCGAASLAMVLEYFGKAMNTGDVLAKLGNPKGFISFSQLGKVAQDMGFDTEFKVDVPFATLKGYIDRAYPVIVVGGYGYLTSTQDKNFKGSHIMVVSGYRDDDSVYCNDPDFWGQFLQDGNHHVYTYEEFANFWRNEGNAEGNHPNSLFVVKPRVVEQPVPEIEVTTPNMIPVKGVVSAKDGVRVRTEPQIQKENIVKAYSVGTVVNIVEQTEGAEVAGNKTWFKVKDGNKSLFVWGGGVKVTDYKKSEEVKKEVEPMKKPEVPNVTPPVVTDDYLKGILAIYKMSRDILKSNDMLPSEEESLGFWGKLRASLKI